MISRLRGWKMPLQDRFKMHRLTFTFLLFFSLSIDFRSYAADLEKLRWGVFYQDPIMLEHIMFKLGGTLSAMDTDGNITAVMNVTTSPVFVDVNTWEAGKYTMVFKSDNYSSIVATIEIKE